MIYLADKKLLFFKSRKTASTSIEIALSANATSQDIVTPMIIKDELIRIKVSNAYPTNWAKEKQDEEQYKVLLSRLYQAQQHGTMQAGLTDIAHQLSEIREKQTVYYNHMPPREVKKKMPEEAYQAATKITAVRHPYEQLVSDAYWRGNVLGDRDITKIINNILEEGSANEEYCFENGKPLCDKYIRYEMLESDLKELENEYGLKLIKHLIITKGDVRKDRSPATDILTREQKRRCFERSRKEFEFFGYDPS